MVIIKHQYLYGFKERFLFDIKIMHILMQQKNIKNRVCVTVLRNMFLKQLDNGAFEPKKLKHEKVK